MDFLSSVAQMRTGWQSRRQERGFHTIRDWVGCEFHQASSNYGAGYECRRTEEPTLPTSGVLGAGIPGQFITLALEPKSCHQKKTQR